MGVANFKRHLNILQTTNYVKRKKKNVQMSKLYHLVFFFPENNLWPKISYFESLGYSIDHPGFKSRLLIYLVISCNSSFYALEYFLHVYLDMNACFKFWNFDTFFTIRSLDLTIVLTHANKFRSLNYLGRYVTEKFKTVIFSSYSNRFSKEW